MLDIDMAEMKKIFDEPNEETPKRKFFPAPDVEEVANNIIPRFHSHLMEAKISYTFRDGNWQKNDRPVPGEAKLISPYYHVLTGLDFGIVVNYRYWRSITSPKQKKAILDHLLSYCYFSEDASGERKWKKITPTIHEFPEVVARNGAYNADVIDLENSLKMFEKG